MLKTSLAMTLISLIASSAHAVVVSPGSCEDINRAIRSLPNEGGTIELSAGNYLCDKPVVIDRDNITIIGKGRTQTFITAADAKPLPVVVIGSVVNVQLEGGYPAPDHVTHNITLRDLAIDGRFHTHPHAGDVECYDPAHEISLGCGSDPGFFIRNNSLTIRRAEHIRVTGIATSGAYSGGIVLEKKNIDVVMDDFKSFDNYFDGFAGYETDKSLFTNFDVSHNQFSGISVDWGFEGNTFDGGTLIENGDNGVFSSDVGHNTYKNLKISGNHDLGIYIAGYFDKAKGNVPVAGTCDGNRIISVTASGVKPGVAINSPCKDTVVEDTHVTQEKFECKWNFPGAEVSYTNSTCSDGNSSIELKN